MENETLETKESRYDRAISLRDEGKLAEALAAMEKVAADFPDYPLAHLALAVFYGNANRNDESMESIKRACELEPSNPFYFTAFSSLAIRGGRRQEAEEALMKAQEARFAAQLAKMRAEEEETNKENGESDGQP